MISQPGDYPYSFRTAFLIVAAALLQPSPAQAESRSKVEFDIANGQLSSTLVELAKQARIPIGMIGDADRDIRTPAIKGRLSVDQALRRLLSGSGLTFRRTRSGDYVIIRARHVHARPAERLSRAPSRATVEDPGPTAAAETIVVTASKTDIPLSHFPGTVAVLTLDGEQIASRPEGGTAVLVDNMPLLAATNLGPGRNKIFARGIADSSFNGQSQANVSLYFDELRLSYAGPDPDLNLFDVRRVEVLPGPYGTLYGAGALGGVVRIEPNAPDATRVEGTIAAHTSNVRYGARGGGLAAALNIPLVSDRLAVRLTGYRTIDPGYIDDTLRGVEDVNRVKTVGGRGLLRFESDEGLAIDLGLIFQRISAADSQYSNDSDNSLRKQVAQAQPYSSSFLMPSLTLRKHWDNLELVSATGWSRQRGEGIADSLGVLSYPESRRTSFLSHETRVSGNAGAFNFLAGLSFARNASREDRALRIFDTEFDRFELRGRTDDLALFGEARTMLSDTITVTAGGRLNYIRDVRHTYFNEQGEAASAARSRISLLPSAALSWTPRAPLLIFLAYRSGSRGGNLLPIPDPTRPEIVTSRPDRLATFEAGWRYSPSNAFELSSTMSYTLWNDVQSDLATTAGNFRTVNLGHARIWSIEASGSWRPAPGLSISGSAFLNNSPAFLLSQEARSIVPDGFLSERNRIPNIASVGARATLAYETGLFATTRLRLATAMRYYGSSVAEFQSRQPEYLEIGAEARLLLGSHWTAMLGVTNLTDVRGNRFAIGNRFAKSFDEQQATPLQPRTIRLGFEVRF